jgi:endonuclease III
MLLETHGGDVPGSFAALEALPGVGHKTASVVLAIAFQLPTFPVDTHIHRRAPCPDAPRAARARPDARPRMLARAMTRRAKAPQHGTVAWLHPPGL